ncbi:MAG: hypothetical protein LC798_22100 [Chloroflexi bacterium]|nr:hypothetical protein [Chloroflexota bacterium]
MMASKAASPTVYGAEDALSSAVRRGWQPDPTPIGAVVTAQTFITRHLAGRADDYWESDSLVPTNGRVFVTTAAAEANGLRPRIGSAWTVPTPFRTTDEELTAYGAEGILVTELVSAALFAVGTALGARVASAVVATTAVRRRRNAHGAPETADRPSGRMTALLDAAVAVLQSEGVTA